MRRVFCLVAIFSLGCLSAQSTLPENPGPHLVAKSTTSVAGLSGGNTSVGLTVYYPAVSTATNAALDASGAPYPMIVFGHGFSLAANLYETLYQHWASHGFVVATPTTEQGTFSGNLPKFIVDMEATVIGVRAAAMGSTGPLVGAVASTATATAGGHSFGGAAAIVAAQQRPDLFSAVFTLAATATSPQGVDIMTAVASLAVPALHMGASTDSVVPPAANLSVIYAADPSTRHLVEIAGGTHSYFHETWYLDRLTEAPGAISVATQQLLVRRATTAFLDSYAKGGSRFFSRLIGPVAFTDPAYSMIDARLATPRAFDEGAPRIGQNWTLVAGREDASIGYFVVDFLPLPSPISTPFGPLAIDPSTAIVIGPLPFGTNPFAAVTNFLPNNSALVGLGVHVQALVGGPSPFLLSPLFSTTVLP